MNYITICKEITNIYKFINNIANNIDSNHYNNHTLNIYIETNVLCIDNDLNTNDTNINDDLNTNDLNTNTNTNDLNTNDTNDDLNTNTNDDPTNTNDDTRFKLNRNYIKYIKYNHHLPYDIYNPFNKHNYHYNLLYLLAIIIDLYDGSINKIKFNNINNSYILSLLSHNVNINIITMGSKKYIISQYKDICSCIKQNNDWALLSLMSIIQEKYKLYNDEQYDIVINWILNYNKFIIIKFNDINIDFIHKILFKPDYAILINYIIPDNKYYILKFILSKPYNSITHNSIPYTNNNTNTTNTTNMDSVICQYNNLNYIANKHNINLPITKLINLSKFNKYIIKLLLILSIDSSLPRELTLFLLPISYSSISYI